MPRKSSKKLRSKRRSRSHSQTGGGEISTGAVPQVSKEALAQAGQIAQQFLNKALTTQTGGGGALQGAELNAAPAAASAPAASAGLQEAMAGGAVAGAVAAAEGYSSLKGSPLVGGGRRRRGRGRGGKSQQQQQQEQEQEQEQQNQQGGMVPGLLTAVETALVPLGLYLGQKALQSRRSGNRSFGKSFDFRRASRRTRRRR